MPLPRLPCATALALGLAIAATPVATLAAMPPPDASTEFFRGFLADPADPFAAPDAPFQLSGGTDASDEESSTPGWLDGNRRYVVGGAAALAAGIAIAGSDASPSRSVVSATTPEAAPTAATPVDLGSTNVIVNPEPGTVLLLGTGLALLVGVGRRTIRRA